MTPLKAMWFNLGFSTATLFACIIGLASDSTVWQKKEAKRKAFTVGVQAGIDYAVQLISSSDTTHCPCDFTDAEIDSILEAK